MKTNHNIYIGDARHWLPKLKDEYEEKVALVVTSPPYFVGRGYEDYLNDEAAYQRLLWEVLGFSAPLIEPHGKVAINFADRYANKKLTGKVQEILYADWFDTIMAYYGFVLWTRIIWRKEYTIGEDCKHVIGKHNKYGHMRVSPNWEYIMVWKRESPGKLPVKAADMTHEEWVSWVDGVWVIPSVKRNIKINGMKIAQFPPELPRRLIKMYTEPGDIVLDPFMGFGTTNVEALRLGRNSLGVELQEKFIPEIERNFNIIDGYEYGGDLFGNNYTVNINT